MVCLLNSQGMKNSKSTESLCLSIVTITQMIGQLKFWLFNATMFIYIFL